MGDYKDDKGEPQNYTPGISHSNRQQTLQKYQIPQPGSQPNRPLPKFLNVNSDCLTDEQRGMYESVLSTRKPARRKKQMDQYICQKCNKEFKNYNYLKTHMTRVHSSEEAIVNCDICDKTFKNKYYLYVHKMYKHFSEAEKYYCQFCLEEFLTKHALHMHVKKIHPNTLSKLKCIDACYKQGKDKYKCHICNKLYKSRYGMKRHILTIHPPLESKLSCPECLKEFKNDQHLKEHIQMYSSFDTELKCNLCDKLFDSAVHMEKHKNTVHIVKNKLRCEKCNKEFANPRYLRSHNSLVHVEVDESNYAHKCEQCGKKFKFNSYLNKHLQIHEQRHFKRIAQLVKTVMNNRNKAKANNQDSQRIEFEFIKCEQVTTSGSEFKDEEESEYTSSESE